MEQLVANSWHQWALFKVIIVAIIIFLVLRLILRSLKILSIKYKTNIGYQRYFPVIEMLIWLTFIYWTLEEIFSEPLYFTVFFITISTIGLIWVGWFGARDYIAGIILRAQDVYETGHQLSVGEVTGKISKLGYLNIEVQEQDGAVLKIPYSKITSSIHLNKNENKMVSTHKFTIKVSSHQLLEGVIDKIRKSILNSPWHASHLTPHINKISEKNNLVDLEVIVSTYGASSFEKLQMQLYKEFESFILDKDKIG